MDDIFGIGDDPFEAFADTRCPNEEREFQIVNKLRCLYRNEPFSSSEFRTRRRLTLPGLSDRAHGDKN